MTREHAWMGLRALSVTIVIVVLAVALIKLFSLTYPFWFAALFAWFLQPFVRFLKHKLRFTSGIASLVGLLGGMLFISSVITGIVMLIWLSIRNFFSQIPEWIELSSIGVQTYFNKVIFPFWQQALGFFNTFSADEQETLRQSIIQLGSQVGTLLGQLGQAIVDALTHFVLGVPTFFVAFLFILLSIYFMGKSWHQYSTIFKRSVPATVQRRFKDFIQALRFRVFGFIRAQLYLMFITAFIVLIGLLILRVDYPITLAVVIGVAEFLPYLGTGTILIPWFIYLYITGNYSLAIGLTILYIIIVIVRQLLEPKVLSTNLNLNPVAILVSLFAGLQLFGAIGLVIGPIILVLIMIMHDIGITKDLKHFIQKGWASD